MNTPTPEETRRLLDVENYGGKALFEFSPDSYDKVNDLIALYKSTAQRADALAEELAVAKSQVENADVNLEQVRAIWKSRAEQAEAKLASLQAENGRLAGLVKEAFDKATESACEAIERIGDCGTQGKVSAIEDASFEAWKDFKLRLALTPPPDASGDTPPSDAGKAGWMSIETAPRGKKLIVGYWNQLGNWRTVMARYYLPMTLPSTDDWASEPECNYAPEGWYEESETHEEIHKVERPPVLWMPLPPAPTPSTEGEGGEA